MRIICREHVDSLSDFIVGALYHLTRLVPFDATRLEVLIYLWLESALLLLGVLELQFLHCEPSRADWWLRESLNDGADVALVSQKVERWSAESDIIWIPWARECSFHIFMPFPRSLRKQIVLGVYKWSESVRNLILSLLSPHQMLSVLKALPVLIKNLKEASSVINILSVKVEVAIFIENSCINFQ